MKRHLLLLVAGVVLGTGMLLTGCSESPGGGDKMATSESKMEGGKMEGSNMENGKMDGGKMDSGKMEGGKMEGGKMEGGK